MKYKKIMLITFILLAILTIGAASAADDVVSDDIAVVDGGDAVVADPEDGGGDEPEGPEIDPDGEEEPSEEIWINNWGNISQEDDSVVNVKARNDTSYSLEIVQTAENEEDEDNVLSTIQLNGDFENKQAWDEDDSFTVYDIRLKDVNFVGVNDGDKIVFKLSGEDCFEVSEAIYHNDEGTITFDVINDEGEDGPEVEINVRDAMYDALDEYFTEVIIPYKQGIFTIYVDDDGDEITLFEEDLATSNRAYEEIGDDDNKFYKFSFTFNDLNNYIAQNVDGADNFDDLVEIESVVSGSIIYFSFDDEENDISEEKEMIISINPDGYIFDDADEDGDVDVDYGDLDVIMYDGWQDEMLLDFMIRKGINGTIVIYLDDEETPAYEKALSELEPQEDEYDDTFNHYMVTVGDLDIDEPGEYVLCVYLQDEEGENIWEYDDEEPETLRLYEPQIVENDNATIEATPITTIISEGNPIITISADDAENDVVIYVDDDETPITKQLKEFKQDEYDDYIITANDLGLGVGEHDLNITYMGANLIATVDLISAVEIELAEPDEVIITGDDFDDNFVTIGLVEEEIYESDIDGKINVTIHDEDGNAVATLEKDITSLYYHDGPRAYVVRVSDMASNLNGTYLVTVRYFDGNQASTEESGMVQFKLFDSADYGTTIKNTITDEEDYVITFTELPPADDVIVKIDGIETEIEEMELFHHFDDEEGVYYISFDDLIGLDEGTHSVVVGIDVNDTFKELAKGNVIVDLEENYDLALTISVANIEEGGVATVVITTNSTFSGAIAVQIGSSNYTVNVVNGQGSTPVANLKANTYTATALFKSDGIFTDATKTATFTVTAKPVTPSTPAAPAAPAKKVIKLTLKKVKVKKSAKKLVLQATLKINGKAPKKGTKITFTFKGKKYIGKTNKKGVAKVTIKKKVLKKLKVGKKVKYTAKYSTKIVKRTVKVKR